MSTVERAVMAQALYDAEKEHFEALERHKAVRSEETKLARLGHMRGCS